MSCEVRLAMLKSAHVHSSVNGRLGVRETIVKIHQPKTAIAAATDAPKNSW